MEAEIIKILKHCDRAACREDRMFEDVFSEQDRLDIIRVIIGALDEIVGGEE